MGRARLPLVNADEQDVLTPARRFYARTRRPGLCDAVKRRYRRRERHEARRELRDRHQTGDDDR